MADSLAAAATGIANLSDMLAKFMQKQIEQQGRGRSIKAIDKITKREEFPM